MFDGIFKIALLCIVIGGASIPVSFTVNPNPFVVWFGNALGSLISAAVVIYVGERITSESFKHRISKRHFGRKIVKAFDEGKLEFFSSLESLRERSSFLFFLAPLREVEWVVYAKPPFGASS